MNNSKENLETPSNFDFVKYIYSEFQRTSNLNNHEIYKNLIEFCKSEEGIISFNKFNFIDLSKTGGRSPFHVKTTLKRIFSHV